MSELGEIVKALSEVAIAAVTALGTIWATWRTTHVNMRTEIHNSLDALVADLTKERAELIRIIGELRAENTELRKQQKERDV